MATIITVPDLNDSVGRIELDGRQYHIRFTYNSTGEFWSFGLYDNDMNPILPMTKIVPYSPLTHYYTYTILPKGAFAAIGIETTPKRNDFKEGKAVFIFVEGEYEELG